MKRRPACGERIVETTLGEWCVCYQYEEAEPERKKKGEEKKKKESAERRKREDVNG